MRERGRRTMAQNGKAFMEESREGREIGELVYIIYII